MKRALAERAKQSESGQPNGIASPVVQVPSSPSSGEPPRKLPRIDEQQQQQREIKAEPTPVPSQATSSAAATTITSPSPRGSALKRQRSSVEEEDEGDSSAFFLKHQNQALASELKGLQYQLRLLEKERDVRRQQCQEATDALKALRATWTQMELGLQLGMPPQPVSDTIHHAKKHCELSVYHLTHSSPVFCSPRNHQVHHLRQNPMTAARQGIRERGTASNSLVACWIRLHHLARNHRHG